MNTQHTPGTWKAEGWEAVTINAHDPSHPQGFVTIVACPGGSDQTTLREMQANARLIAAAPDLLAALIDAEKRLNGAGMLGAGDIVTAAIARATGAV